MGLFHTDTHLNREYILIFFINFVTFILISKINNLRKSLTIQKKLILCFKLVFK